MLKNKGFTIPFVVIFVGIFLSIPLLFWFYSKDDSQVDVKGSSSSVVDPNSEGFLVDVTSEKATWDLYAYACESVEKCEEALTSGDRFLSMSGGPVNSKSIFVEKTDAWGTNEFVKVYVKSGWGSGVKSFKVNKLSNNSEVATTEITSDGAIYDVLVFPVSTLEDGVHELASFTE